MKTTVQPPLIETLGPSGKLFAHLTYGKLRAPYLPNNSLTLPPNTSTANGFVNTPIPAPNCP